MRLLTFIIRQQPYTEQLYYQIRLNLLLLAIWDLIQALQKKKKTCAISFNYNMLVILYNVKWASSKKGDPDVMLQNVTSHETCPICYPG